MYFLVHYHVEALITAEVMGSHHNVAEVISIVGQEDALMQALNFSEICAKLTDP
jgi:hypothetical protein